MASCFAWKGIGIWSTQRNKSSRRVWITPNSGLAFSSDKLDTKVLVDKRKPQTQTFKKLFNLAPHSPATCNLDKPPQQAPDFLSLGLFQDCQNAICRIHLLELMPHDITTSACQKVKSFNKFTEKIWRDKYPEEIGLRSWKISENSSLSTSIPTKRNWVSMKIQAPNPPPQQKTHVLQGL